MAISSDVPGLDDNEMFDSDTDDDDEEVEEGNHDNGMDGVEDLCDGTGLDDNGDDNEMLDSDTDDDEEVEEGDDDNGMDGVEEHRVLGVVPVLDDNRDYNEIFDSDIDDDEVVEEGDDDNGMDVEEHRFLGVVAGLDENRDDNETFDSDVDDDEDEMFDSDVDDDEVVEEGDDDNGMDGVEEHLGIGVQNGDGGCGEREPYFYICERCLEVVTHSTDLTATLCEPCQNLIDRLHQFTGLEIPNTSIIILKHPYDMEMLSSEDDATYIKYYDAVMQVFDESFDGYRVAKQSMDNRFLYIFCNLLHGQPISVCTLQLLGCDIGIIGMAATVQMFRKKGSCKYLIQIMEQILSERTSFKTLMVASLSTTVKYWSKIRFFNIPKDQELNLRSKFNLDYYRSCTILAKKL